MLSFSPSRTPRLQLAAEQPSTGKCWISPKKDNPCPKAKEILQQDGRRGEITFRIKPQMPQKCSEGTNKTLCTKGPRKRSRDPPLETEPDLPLSVWVSPVEAWLSTDLSQGQGPWLQQTWMVQCVAWVLLEEVTISAIIELLSRPPANWRTSYQRSSHTVAKVIGPTTDFPTLGFIKRTENLQRNRLLECTTKVVCTRTQKKRAVTSQKTEPDLPVSVRECLAEVWVKSGLPRSQGHSLQQSWEPQLAGLSPCEEGYRYCHIPTIVCPEAKLQGGNTGPTISRELG